MTCVACLALLSGCVSPTHHGRCHVGVDLAARTGHELGPGKPPCHVAIPELVNWDDGLSEEEAVAVGLWNNPAYQELLADLEISRADIVQAAQLQNPQITTLFPVSAKQWEFGLNVPLDVLWLRPIRVAAAQLESERVAERLTQDGLNIVRDVRVAYVDWQLALQRAELAEEGSTLRRDIARIAEARLAAGEVAELDVSAMRLDALFGKGDAVKAAGEADLARERLRYLLGIQLTDISIKPSRRPEPPIGDFDVANLVEEAVSSRPDLRAVRLAVDAANQREDLARRDVWQVAGILPDINGRGSKGFEAGPGLQFTLPVFHQNQGAIALAEADAKRLRRQHIKLRDTAALEVRQAYTQLLHARQDLMIWREQVVPQAQAAVTSARQAIEEDGISLLLVLETTRQLLTARGRELEAAAQVHRAVAELERGVGRRLWDAPTEFDVPDGESSDAETVPAPSMEVRMTTS